MKLTYIANIRIPTEKAHGIQIMKMCEAFSLSGIELILVVPKRFNKIKEEVFGYYGVERLFEIKKLPTVDLVRFGKIGFWIQSISFAVSSFLYLIFKKVDVIYSRDELPLFLLSFVKNSLFWEAHDGRNNFFVKYVLRKIKGVVTITQGLKDFYVSRGIIAFKILVAHDGVHLEDFNLSLTKNNCRIETSLPLEKKVILYSGSFSLYDWKGIDILLEASKSFSNDYIFVFVGGLKKEIFELKKEYENDNIKFISKVSHKNIPKFLKASDLLVLPNKKGNIISERYTSPLKLFEYMASGVPIIASRLPSIEEVLNDDNAVLFRPNDSQSLANGIKKVLQDSNLSGKISKQALHEIQNYTWNKRVKKIIKFVK